MSIFDFFKRRNSRTLSIIIGIFLVCMFIVFWQGIFHLYQKSQVLDNDRGEKSKILSYLIDERKKLEAEITFLKSDSALEREAKSRLNYKKEGEEVVVIVPEEKKFTSNTPAYTSSFFWVIKQFFIRIADSF